MEENFKTDKIITTNIADEMRKSYIDYAMSVIVARALPDVRDGLKPVHRRILHSMNELSLEPNKPYKKCARITGDVMGKYHPHGNASIYDALVRMAQDFSMRYMLVDGHGNFGSMDGDEAAAERYTEARLAKIAMEMITDIEKDTVEFVPNYTEELKEPKVLPARYPNLLVNGSSGIAVGMATNIPPHNLTEAIDAVVKIIDNQVEEGRETEIEELLKIVTGPDFPTGANILGMSGIKAAYMTGRGRVVMRATCDIEQMPGSSGREMIVVTQMPYQVNKGKMQEKVAELVKEKKIEGISDIRDESDRNGVRVVIELKKDANAHVVLNTLYKYTQLQESFGVNMLSLVNGEPRVLNLKQMLVYYLDHQKDVVTRRTQFDLDKAERRIHIVEGFLKALDYIDEIIAIIRKHRSVNDGSKPEIIERFGFTQAQADAIVEMRLRALSGMERERLQDEFDKLTATIEYLKSILADELKLLGVIKDEILVIRDKYGDDRRTVILQDEGDIDIEDLIDEEMCVITLTHLDYVKRTTLDTYKTQSRGGKGVLGLTTRDEDLIKKIFISSTHDDILFITTLGRAYKLRAYQIAEAGRSAKGTAIVNLLKLNEGESIAAALPISDYSKGYLTMVTRSAVIKRTPLSAFEKFNKNGVIAFNLREDDTIVSVIQTEGDADIFMASNKGKGLRFPEQSVREGKRTSTGRLSMVLDDDDYIVGAESTCEGLKFLFVSEKGYGKTTDPDEFRVQGRRGKGIIAYKCTDRTGGLTGIARVTDSEELMLINSNGVIIRIRIGDIRTIGRATGGVKLINLDEGVTVVGLAKIGEEHIVADDETNEANEAK